MKDRGLAVHIANTTLDGGGLRRRSRRARVLVALLVALVVASVLFGLWS